ncbi:MAG TPA: YetF domain-containing protein [Puia sp.]|nr:YetF domain-containing protein [Puia sp.]
MDILSTLFGHGKDLNSLQMICRAAVSFFITLILIRVAGIRTFGKKTPFDNVITIMLGSIFSRVVVGASPFISTTLACLAFVLIHRLLAWASFYSDWVGRLIKGEASTLYADGRKNTRNMRAANVSEKDLRESVRQKINEDSFAHVREIIQERNGEITVVKQ